jgi:ABC-type nitrate/sulfonate/bicarbonate transport system substrate-binding protein
MFRLVAGICLIMVAGATAFPAAGQSEDMLKLAVGAPNNWDSGVPEIGQRAGIFKKHGIPGQGTRGGRRRCLSGPLAPQY